MGTETAVGISGLLRRRVAIPQEHGAWALFLCPLVIGMAAGGRWHVASAYLGVAALAAFFMRQPLMALAKVRAGRRPATDLPAAWFWLAVYGTVAGLHVVGLTLRGFGYVLHLAVPGAIVAVWHLALVMRRAERRQRLLEILAVGGLALSAPAGMWVGRAAYEPRGWLLWALLWSALASTILHAHLLLAQRARPAPPQWAVRLRDARAPLGLALVNLVVVLALAATGGVSAWLVASYALLVGEALRGALRPAEGARPKRIGLWQLAVLVAFTALFIVGWCAA